MLICFWVALPPVYFASLALCALSKGLLSSTSIFQNHLRLRQNAPLTVLGDLQAVKSSMK